jgi:hypothetical protein
MFEPGKIYKTRGGEDALIYCVDAPGNFPVHGRVGAFLLQWAKDGNYWAKEPRGHHSHDLIAPAPKCISRTVWVNVYENGTVFCETASEAHDVIACHIGKKLRIAVPCRLEEIGE